MSIRRVSALLLLAVLSGSPAFGQTEDAAADALPPSIFEDETPPVDDPLADDVDLEDDPAERDASAIRRALEGERAQPAEAAPGATETMETLAPDLEAAAPGPDPGDGTAAAPLAATPADEPERMTEETAREKKEQLDEARTALEEVEEVAAEANIQIELPQPCTGPWDWVQYSSGEWLRGEFKRMRKKSFEMRSTRFDRRTTDWKHIRAFCFTGNTRFILYDHTQLVGKGRLEKGVLTVESGDVTQSAKRSDIWVILPGSPTEFNRWRATASLGLDTYTGNTDSAGVTGSSTIDREDSATHLHVDYTGTFNQADNETIAARHRVNQWTNVYFTRKFYASLPFIGYTSDRFQNLQHRVVPGLSLGYQIFDLDKLEWTLDGGLAYQYTQYVSVAAGQDLRENDWGPRISTTFEWDIVTDLTLDISHSTVVLVRDSSQTNYHTQAGLSYDITDLLFIEATVAHDRVRNPRETAEGTVPEKDDFRYTFSLGLNFD